MNKTLLKAGCLTFLLAASGLINNRVQGQTNNLPSSFALPAGGADTSKKGFLVRTWQSPGQPGTLAWTEDQLAGLHGDNTADTSTFTDKVFGSSYLDETGVINYWDTGGEGDFPNNATQNVPGATGDSYALEIFTLLDLPAGTLTMGVNSDDGFRVAALHSPDARDKLSLNAGEYDAGRGAADSLFTLVVEQAGVYPFRLIYFEGGGDSSVEWFTMTPDGTRHLINDATDSASIKAYRTATGGARAYASSALPRPGDKAASPNVAISVNLVDGADPIDTATVKLSFDGAPVVATASKAGNVTSVTYSSSSLSPAGSTHTVSLTYSEGASPVTTTWSYTVGQYAALPPTAKVTADTSKPGFIWNIFANAATASDGSNQRVENALAGVLKDADGNPLPNLADPAAKGVASAAASAPNPANAPITFEIPTVINVSQTDATTIGNFTPDEQMPGVPATDSSLDGMSVEIITYIDLPAGGTTMGINSDDGFRTTAGNPLDVFQATVLGQFDAGRGAADTTFNIVAQEAGVYAFRTIYFEGGGDANIEWFTVKADGTKVLLNDTANGGLKAYRVRTGDIDPYIKFVSPAPVARQVNRPNSSLSVVLSDGTSKTIDDNSIVLQVDGKTVTPTKNRQGKTVTLTHTPDGLQTPSEQHTASLTFKDSTGATRTQPWTFYNLKNLILPAAKITENFDSYPEDTEPTGWVATNFSSHCADGRDVTSQTSESYENWVLVSTDNMTSLDGGSANVAPGQTFNGQPVTTISSGNVLYAESDGRCNTDSAGGPNKGQAQFIVSKAFDCSQIENVVLSFSALYTQNQDSIGAVEYSVDGGNTWLPIVYYLEPPDIVVKSDGTVDAVATFTAPNTDTAAWFVNGVLKGAGAHGYGDGIAAPITQDLAIYVAPRLNDDQFEGARIEAYRLPQAGKKSDVRLRFAALGTDSWWFAVDNIAFYDVPSTITPPPTQAKFNPVTFAAGNLTISWTGSGTLEQADSVAGPWTAAPSQANPQTIPTSGTAKFYRIRQ